jgi:CheY-like chemotaxis protein
MFQPRELVILGVLVVELAAFRLLSPAMTDDHRQFVTLANIMSEVVVARDGAEALDYLYRRCPYANLPPEDPGLILLDNKMPKVDGLEVLKQIKSDQRLKTIPVVMLTSSREHGDLLKSYHLGVNAYVVKPVEFHEFVKAVRELGAFWGIINEPPPRARP